MSTVICIGIFMDYRPQYNINSYPSFCRDVSFDINELELSSRFTKYYSTESPNQDFWEHEWKKHGSCMFNEMDEFDYFNTALKLFTEAVNETTKKNILIKNQINV